MICIILYPKLFSLSRPSGLDQSQSCNVCMCVPPKIYLDNKQKCEYRPFLFVFVLGLLSAHIKRVSISHMQGFRMASFEIMALYSGGQQWGEYGKGLNLEWRGPVTNRATPSSYICNPNTLIKLLTQSSLICHETKFFSDYCVTTRPSYKTFSITKHYNIEIYLSSTAQSIGQYFPVLPRCQSHTENQLFQY